MNHVARTILVIILIIFLLGGFSGRFGGYGYGYGHGGVGVIGIILIILVVLYAAWAGFDPTAECQDEPSSRCTRKTTSSTASDGCERQCSEPTMASSRPRA